MHICLFDIDGTLISSAGAGKAALEAGLAENFAITQPLDIPLSGRTDRAIVTHLIEHYGLTNNEETYQRLLAAYLRHLPAALQQKSGRVLPGVTTLLAELTQRPDVMIGLLTGNVRTGAQVKLSHYGLWDLFPFGGFGDNHLDRDDVAREALAAVRARTDRVILDRVWVIGDTPYDIRCARAIGARAVAVSTGWHSREELAEYQPDVLLEDLEEMILLFK